MSVNGVFFFLVEEKLFWFFYFRESCDDKSFIVACKTGLFSCTSNVACMNGFG